MKKFIIFVTLITAGCQHTNVTPTPRTEFENLVSNKINEKCVKHLELLGCKDELCKYQYSYITEGDAKRCSQEAADTIEKENGSKIRFEATESSAAAFAGMLISGLTIAILAVGL